MLIAHATNLGLTRMADACGISYDVLAWTAEWYVREETLRAANLTLIGYHQKLPLTAVFGEVLGNTTDIPITERATDTHGVTLVNFALFDLLGLQFSSRTRDVGKITFCRTGAESQAARTSAPRRRS